MPLQEGGHTPLVAASADVVITQEQTHPANGKVDTPVPAGPSQN